MELPDSIQVVSDKYLQNISDAFKTLYNEEQLSDVTIYCKEGSLKAHKLILAASSPYFCKIFRENRNEFPILILHGTSMTQMKNLIDLLYTGITDVKKDDIESLNRLIREFEIKGVNFGQETSSSNVRLEINGSNVSPDSIHNRDTRFKGKKRVAVDYEHDENLPSTSKIDTSENHLPKRSNLENSHNEELNQVKIEAPSPVPTESTIFSMSDINSISDRSSYTSNSTNKISAWAKKQRKFKCHLCPSSFKRSSHLSRHQLVHTGERPYSCNRCDKAFSRVDKLKHHIRKAHEFIPDSMYERIDDTNDSESESSMRNQTSPHQNNAENVYTTEYVDLPAPKNSQGSSPPLFTISHISTILEDSFVNPTKKGRGRPRKYPLSTAPPSVLNSNQEQPISNCIKVKKKRRSWVDLFISENENKRTSMRLREKTHKNTNEDYMFSQMEHKIDTNLMCEICDKPYVYEGKLKAHMRKIHNISDYAVNEQSDFEKCQENSINTEPHNDNIGEKATVCSLQNVNSNTTGLEDYDKNKDKAQMSNQINCNPDAEEGSRTTEHLSYEELRKLLPKECSLQPIVVDYEAPGGNSEPNKMKVCVSSSNTEELYQNDEGSVSVGLKQS
ncbi:zinc finger homeobox protein 4-like isoform X2 [Coccinella septempunctata]|uniref:zinc finger homeobox protein 4-like isoform X2 n=1 Tax=Coccinella septempunctata TaxID=41139 RepID=UPI001D08E2B4|nr:zinc finger homeobox protein 4-like isoform X2 [Coccinella septempunctata]